MNDKHDEDMNLEIDEKEGDNSSDEFIPANPDWGKILENKNSDITNRSSITTNKLLDLIIGQVWKVDANNPPGATGTFDPGDYFIFKGPKN